MRMSYSEYLSWVQYYKKRGTFNVGLRLEQLFARIMYQIHCAVGGKRKFEDFIRYQDEKVATIGDIARMIGMKPKEDKQ